MAYYSVFIPSKVDSEVNNDENQFVFTEMDEALKVLKNYKEARLKVFKNNEDATKFSQFGFEIKCTTGLKSPSAASNLEKAAFRAPTKQELIQFRKAIEEDKYDVIEKKIWENPRYLINSGDTPTSLKDGTRYNALHVCALHQRAKIADLILQSISKYRFIELLHGTKNQKICQEICEILLDYYLNMPEKGRSETPLHLAVKYGSVEVVEVLTTYPQCKMTPNLENLHPKDLICSRMDKPSQELKDKIAKLLEERFYVPVIRSVDNSLPPIIGEPFSPANPPILNSNPMSPELEIQAFAGPMNKDQAQTFRRRWKTPPRGAQSANNSYIISSPYTSPIKKTINLFPNKSAELNVDDTENGNLLVDKLSEEQAENNNGIPNSSFPISISTPLRMNFKRDLFFTYRDKSGSPLSFESSDFNLSTDSEINEKDVLESSCRKERHIKITDTEKGLELIGRELAKEQNIEWKEYWDFLGSFVDIASPDGLLQLENYLKTKSDEIQNKLGKKTEENLMDNLCNALDKLGLYKDKNVSTTHLIYKNNKLKENESKGKLIPNAQNTAPYLCVEKSFQVFAKRMTKTIVHNIDSVVSINDAFNSELKRLKSLVCSFKDDTRFTTVQFSLVHSRFANLIVAYLKNFENNNDNTMNKIQRCFQQIIESKLKSSLDKQFRIHQTDENGHLKCLSEFILEYIKRKDDKVLPENLKTEQICMETWLSEKTCTCNWDTVSNRHGNRKKRFELSDVSRKLFENTESRTQNNDDKITKLNNINNLERSQDTSSDNLDLENDEDIFWSDAGSDEDDDNFFTPPESPSMLELDISNVLFENYNIYLLGNEPTKRDLDVLNALFNVDIDRDTYPNIHRWRAAILRHPNSEQDNFPSPSVIVKRRTDNASRTKRRTDNASRTERLISARRLFTFSPIRSAPSSPSLPKTVDVFNHFRHLNNLVSCSGTNSNSPSDGGGSSSPNSGKNLSFMNISD